MLAGSAFACTACEHPADADPGDSPRAPPPAVRLNHAPTVRYHMQQHVHDLRTIERMLLGGDLVEAKALAFMLTKPEADPELASWGAQSRRAVEAARGLAAARTVEEALRYELRVAEACADCHLSAQHRPAFASLPSMPPDRPTAAARMARHQWAADRLWEGLIGPVDERWRIGLEALAVTPVPFSPLTEAPDLATRLQQRARQALAAPGPETLHGRATAYREILDTCAACHRELGKR